MTSDRPVLVVGAGLGGLTAALRLAEAGRPVILIDARAEVGGTVAFSGGGVHIWGARNWAELQPHSPLSDPLLGEVLASHFERYVDWLEATGAPGRYDSSVVRGLSLLKYQIGRSIAPHHRRAWLDFIASRIIALGGTLRLGVRATGVERIGGGFRLALDTGEQLQGSALVLAAGGFQANPDLLARHASVDPGLLVQRSVAENRGDGLLLALSVGAAPVARMDTLYGHLMPAPPCRIDWTDPIMPLVISAFYAEHGLLIDHMGRRFTDEGAGELNGATINAAALRRTNSLWIILDQRIRAGPARYTIPDEMLTPGSLRYWRLLPYLRLSLSQGGVTAWIDTIALARNRGAHIIRTETIDAMVAALTREGVDETGLRQTLLSDTLNPPKTKAAHPIAHPPFLAIKVGVGVSMTYGGVAIDVSARALDAGGDPVPGLFAVPGTAGGINYLHYAGALAACGVFGLIAAETILSE